MGQAARQRGNTLRRNTFGALAASLLATGLTVVAAGPAHAAVAPCDVVAWQGSDGSTNQIWVADADVTKRVPISTVDDGTDPTYNYDVQWSPDSTRLTWRGSVSSTYQIRVADADGTNRAEISTVAAGTDPTNNLKPQWRPRSAVLDLSAEASTLTLGETGTTITTTSGTVTGSTSTIPTLAGTATISGTVSDTRDCGAAFSASAALPSGTTDTTLTASATEPEPEPDTEPDGTDGCLSRPRLAGQHHCVTLRPGYAVPPSGWSLRPPGTGPGDPRGAGSRSPARAA